MERLRSSASNRSSLLEHSTSSVPGSPSSTCASEHHDSSQDVSESPCDLFYRQKIHRTSYSTEKSRRESKISDGSSKFSGEATDLEDESSLPLTAADQHTLEEDPSIVESVIPGFDPELPSNGVRTGAADFGRPLVDLENELVRTFTAETEDHQEVLVDPSPEDLKRFAKKSIECLARSEVVLDGLHNDLEKERQARHSLDETNRSLASEKDQLKSQLDQSRTSALSPEDLDAYRKEIEARCRLELNEKLAQVNRYLDEQNLTRSSLEKFRAENENLLKRDYNRRISDLELEIRKYKELYGVSIPVRDRPAALESDPELKRLQALLEKERRQREKLESRLDRIIDRKIDTSHLPQDRTRTLDLARGSLHSTGGLRSGTEYENLLEKVRRQLDNSISRHLGTTKLELEIYSQNPYASWDRSLSGKR